MKFPKALVVCLLVLLRTGWAIDDSLTLVDGVSTNLGAFIPSGTNNVLVVTNGGTATLTSFASQPAARSNSIVVVGAGSTASSSTVFAFAAGGISNALVFRDGGSIKHGLSTGGTNNLVLFENTSAQMTGMTLGGRSNQYVFNNASVLASGTCMINTSFGQYTVNGSVWSDTDFATDGGRSNLFVLSNGTQRFANNWEFWGLGNRLEVRDAGTLWQVTNILSVVNPQTINPGNVVNVLAGAHAEVLRDFDFGAGSSFNQLTADGVGTQINVAGSFNAGAGGTAKSNLVSVTGGAYLRSGSAMIGVGLGNSVTISGAGTSWDNAGLLQMNDGTNRLDILDGAALTTGRFSNNGKSNVITLAPTATLISGDFSVGKNLKVTGGGALRTGGFVGAGPAGATMELAGGTSWIASSNLSFSASGNTLTISEGATAQAGDLDMGVYANAIESAVSNVVAVTGQASSLAVSSIVATSRWQSIFVSGGGRLDSSSFVSMRGNTLIDVSGANSTWMNAGDLLTASQFTNDIVRIDSGGFARNYNATIGMAPLGPFRTYSQLSIDGPTTKWITTTNLIVGFNANSNLFLVSSGAVCSVGQLIIGNSHTNKISPGAIGGSENLFAIDGAARLSATKIVRLGYGSSSNVFDVSGGATVYAGAFTVGEIPPGVTVASNLASNIVSVTGPGSRISISSNFSAGGSSHLVLSNAAQITAGGPVILPDHATIRAQSELISTGVVTSASLEFLIEDAHVSASEFQFGGLFRAMHTSIAGLQAVVDASAIRLATSDPRSADSNGQATMDVLSGANVTTALLTLGQNSPTNPPVLNIDGGFVSALGADGSGTVELYHGSLNVHRGALRAGQLRVEVGGDDVMINADGGLLVANGSSDADGDLRVGVDHGTAELRGTNRFSKLSVAGSAGSIGSVAVLGGQMQIADAANVGGLIQIGEGGSGELSVSNAVISAAGASFATATGGSALVTMQGGGQIHVTGDINFGAGAEVKFVVGGAGPASLIADGAVTLAGKLTVAVPTGLQPQPGDSIALITGGSIAGGFSNVVSGNRITAADGVSSFVVNVSPTTVTLTGFQSEIRLNVSVSADASGLVLTYPASLGAVVETSTNLVDWVKVDNAVEISGDEAQVQASIDKSEGQRFYRLRK